MEELPEPRPQLTREQKRAAKAAETLLASLRAAKAAEAQQASGIRKQETRPLKAAKPRLNPHP